MAAGEIPSPEAIAAAGQVAGIPLRYGLLCGLGILLGLLVVTLLSDATTLVDQTDLKKPDALAQRASDIVKELGYREPPKDHAYGFIYAVGESGKPAIRFWHRQSPSALVPELFAGSLTAAGSYSAKGQGTLSLSDPSPGIPGEASVLLDPQGRLVEFRAIPAASEDDESESRSSSGGSSEPKLTARYISLFQRAGLIEENDEAIDPGKFSASQPAGTVPVPCDARRSWRPVRPKTEAAADVVAASYGDRPVYFRVGPGQAAGARRLVPGFPPAAYEVAVVIIALPTIVAAILLVRRNLRRGRGDRRGAIRLACYVFVVSTLAWLMQTSRGAQPAPVLVLVLRKQWLAACGYVLIWTPIWSIGVGHPYVSWFAAAVSCTLVVFLLTRFGLVAPISYTCARLMLNYPITADLSQWYAGGTTVLPLAVILALAGWALHTAVGDRPSPRAWLAGWKATGSSPVA